MYSCKYADRELYIQIKIDNLVSVHGSKYPMSFYEKKTDKQICGMHTSMMVRYAKSIGA